MSLIKRTLLLFQLTLCMVLAVAPDAAAEVAKSFDSRVRVQDGVLDVRETIVVDFEGAERHGIYRFIPVQYYRKNVPFKIGIRLLAVMDGHANPLPYKLTDQGPDISIRIGDPHRTVSGTQEYVIHYQVSRAINYFDGEPEVYWNATGSRWMFPIESARARFELPSLPPNAKPRAQAFTGQLGSTTPATTQETASGFIFTTTNLEPGEGLTFVVRLPAGSVVPDKSAELRWMLLDWAPAYGIPAVTSVIVFLFWYYFGRDPGNVKVAGVEWNPPKDLTPAEVGTLVDERCDVADIVSTLIDLAARGFLKIKEIPPQGFLFSSKDYLFTRLHENVDGLKQHETLFLAALFGYGVTERRLSDVKYHFYTYIPQIKQSVYDALMAKNFFSQEPEQVRRSYLILSAVVMVIGLFFLPDQLPMFLGFVVSGAIVALVANIMPARTAQGVDACRQAMGFKRFVMKAEKERIRVLAKEDPTIFGRLLPYAMVLGAADQWARAFSDLMIAPPDWYESSSWSFGRRFSSIDFVNDLGSGMRAYGTAFTSVPPSVSASGSESRASSDWGAGGGFSGFDSGSGFSGGGFGGGGGGSW